MADEPYYHVVWPLGRSHIQAVDDNVRLGDLSNKTVAFVWDYLFKGPEMFEIIKDRMREQFSDVRFVDYETFGNIHGSDAEEKASLSAMPEKLEELGIDAAVVAVGA